MQQTATSEDEEEEGEVKEGDSDGPLANFPIPYKVLNTNHKAITHNLTHTLRTAAVQEVKGRRHKRSRHAAEIEGELHPTRKRPYKS